MTEQRPTAFLLPGQGAQYQGMAVGLYGWEPVFTGAMDRFFAALGADGAQVRDDWLAARPRIAIDEVTRSQPLLFAVDHALAVMLRDWGIRPDALLGHSAGELAAGAFSGVFDPDDAARVMWDRARRLAELPSGGMLVVAAEPGALADHLSGDVVVGAVNAPRQTVLAGPSAALAATAARLRADGYTCRAMSATTAFHSPAVLAAVDTGAYLGLRLNAPTVPVWSGYTAGPLSPEQATDPRLWARHPVDPVRFGPALDGLLASVPGLLLIETGPGQSLSTLARRHPRVRDGNCAVVSLLPAAPKGAQEDRRSLLRAVRRLRDEGFTPRVRGEAAAEATRFHGP